MERDFMGLTVKQETPDETVDSGPVRSSAMQWSFSNKVSAVPQLLSFQGAQVKKPKTSFDSLASTGLVTITTAAEAFNSAQKPYSGVTQKTIFPGNHGGLHYKVTTYPAQNFETHGLQDVRVPPVTIQTNQTVSLAGQYLTLSASPQPLAVPMTNPLPAVPPSSSVMDATGLSTNWKYNLTKKVITRLNQTNMFCRSASKTSGVPAQLTIFYAGSVCVYDNVPPEQAQAIMLLAGTGSHMTSRTTVPTASILAPVIPSPIVDGFGVNKPYGATLHCSSPVSVTSINVSQSAGGLGSNNDPTAIKPGVGPIPNKVEPVKVVNLIGSVPATFLSSGAVPQARRKSLARFLEKRKERVTDASPYTSKQSLDCSTPVSANISVNSSGSCHVQEIK